VRRILGLGFALEPAMAMVSVTEQRKKEGKVGGKGKIG
jgi:hypothetical protein